MTPAPLVTDNPPSYEEDRTDDEDASLPHPLPMAGVIAISSSDEDENDSHDTAMNSGYELLPQDPDNDVSEEQLGSWSEYQHSITVEHNSAVECSAEEGPPENAECNTESSSSLSTILMDQDHIEKIKSAMIGFSLPSSSIPSWANLIPEEQWKCRLLTIMNSRSSKDSLSIDLTSEVHRP